MKEFEVSRPHRGSRLGFPAQRGRAPPAYDDARHGFRLTDETYTLPQVRISRKEAFSFGLARKLLAHYEGTPLPLDMRSVLDKIICSAIWPSVTLARKDMGADSGTLSIKVSDPLWHTPPDLYFLEFSDRLPWSYQREPVAIPRCLPHSISCFWRTSRRPSQNQMWRGLLHPSGLAPIDHRQPLHPCHIQ